jgi:hypothetical protein
MTKEEFLSMLNTELENLEKDYQTARQRVEYFRAVNSRGKEFQEAEYQLKMVQQKVNALRRLVTLPAYARIQAMSDAEIEEYKKGKIKELELKIKEIQAREEQEKAKLSQLKAEQDQLMAQFGSLSRSERDRAIYRGQQLTAEISRYDVNNQWGVFAEIKREIDEVRKQQEQIKAMTSQEIKQQLSSEMKESHDLAQTIEWTRNPIDASTELEASVASDPEKAQQMANLLTYYGRLSDEQSQIKGRMYLAYGLPKVLEKKLTEYSYYYISRTNEVHNPDKLMESVQEFEGSFEQAKASFNEQFTEQKLSKLVGREYGMDSSEVDMGFLQQHTDKLGDGELDHLQSLVEQRNKLSKKIFKTRDTKWEIENLNNRIKQEQSKIYKEIIGWYESQSKDLLGISYGVQFYSLEALQDSLKRCKEDIGRSEQAITEVKERIQKAKAEMEQQKQSYETRKTETAQQIRALGGERHKETDIPYASERADYNLNQIANAQNRVYQRDVVDRVQQEAQNQADVREAELRGITVEQLLQMRQQAQAMVDESMVETAEEEVSHGMKR